MIDTPESRVQEALTACRGITMANAKTFYFASRFLPLQKRNACYAVYAFCRYIDDLVDVHLESGNVSIDSVSEIVGQWRHGLDEAYNGTLSTPNKVLLAWEHVVNKYNIPRELPELLVSGVLDDITVQRFATFDDLKEYCYKVASVVGLMTSRIFGYATEDALAHAVDLGIAMQLTNIIRDVREDANINRIYLPLEDLNRAGIAQEDILVGRNDSTIRKEIERQAERAYAYYESANRGIAMLDPDSRMTVTLMSANYMNILNVVRKSGYDVMTRRASTNLFQKLYTIPQAWSSSRKAQ